MKLIIIFIIIILIIINYKVLVKLSFDKSIQIINKLGYTKYDYDNMINYIQTLFNNTLYI